MTMSDAQPGTKFRANLAARREAEATGQPHPAPTERDDRNLADFDRSIGLLCDLLEEELTLIKASNLTAMDQLFTRKAGLVQIIERVTPLVDPFLRSSLAEDTPRRAQVERLNKLIREDLLLLDRLAEAAATIAKEHARIVDRHSLKGLYEKSGRKVGTSPAASRSFDQEH